MLSILKQTDVKPSLWEGHFDENGTRRETLFDFVFGALTPLACFALDPIFIRGWLGNERGLIPHGGAIYIFSTMAIFFLLVWLSAKNKVKSWSGVFAGTFYAGALFCLLVGIITLPFLFILGGMLLFGILELITSFRFNLQDLATGFILTLFFLLGCTPILTGFVYWRNGSRAAQTSKATISSWHFKGLAVSTVISLVSLSIGLQLKVERETKQAVAAILQSQDGRDDDAALKLKILSWTPNFRSSDVDELAFECQKIENGARLENIAKTYQETTGMTVGERLKRLSD
jgi:hypothetical protein